MSRSARRGESPGPALAIRSVLRATALASRRPSSQIVAGVRCRRQRKRPDAAATNFNPGLATARNLQSQSVMAGTLLREGWIVSQPNRPGSQSITPSRSRHFVWEPSQPARPPVQGDTHGHERDSGPGRRRTPPGVTSSASAPPGSPSGPAPRLSPGNREDPGAPTDECRPNGATRTGWLTAGSAHRVDGL